MAVAVQIMSRPPEFPARQLVRPGRPLRLFRGGVIEDPVIAYERWGTLNPSRDNAVLLFTGMSPSAHAASSALDPAHGWWESMIGPGRPIDTARYYVVCVNSIGSPWGSSSPASIDPRTGRTYATSFPEVSVEDIARGGHEVLRSLGIERARCVIGPSLGGMTALAYAVQFPDAAENLISISGAAAATPFAISLRSLQREIVRSDPAWQGGQYEPGHGPRTGLRLARKLGTITYRSAEEWQQRFGRQKVTEPTANPSGFRAEFEIESYLEHQSIRFSETFDANCYLKLSHAMDEFDMRDHGGGSFEIAFAKIRARRALVIGVQTDMLFPLHQQREIADTLRAGGVDVEFHPFPSIQGHDSFLVDDERFEPAIGTFLQKL
jgi:homoserine O-acetyltransferase/O-succinyltransferase